MPTVRMRNIKAGLRRMPDEVEVDLPEHLKFAPKPIPTTVEALKSSGAPLFTPKPLSTIAGVSPAGAKQGRNVKQLMRGELTIGGECTA